MASEVRNIPNKCDKNLNEYSIFRTVPFQKNYIVSLPKINKVEKSIRPIVSAVRSQTHNLGKWFIQKFQNLPNVQNSLCVKI